LIRQQGVLAGAAQAELVLLDFTAKRLGHEVLFEDFYQQLVREHEEAKRHLLENARLLELKKAAVMLAGLMRWIGSFTKSRLGRRLLASPTQPRAVEAGDP
jgi:hypothetical protein